MLRKKVLIDRKKKHNNHEKKRTSGKGKINHQLNLNELNLKIMLEFIS